VNANVALRRIARAPRRVALAAYVPARTANWPEATRLFVVGDDVGWAIDDVAARLVARAGRLGYAVAPASWARYTDRQSVFYPEHFGALRPRWLESSHRLGLSYFHGRPGTAGFPEFDRAYERLRRYAKRVDRVQVTHAEMHELVLDAGVDPASVFRVPIGIDLARFPQGDARRRADARAALGLPGTAFVVGSFQKDGVGWGAGLEPKTIKGPDMLLSTLDQLRRSTPELMVLLTGPARGYVRRGLERRGIPYRHQMLASREQLAEAYRSLDVYLVTARQEGGPKAVLESLASGVPLVTTRVGQAQELLTDGVDALLADVDDSGALADAVVRVRDDAPLVARLRAEGRATAERYADERLDPEWAALLDGFVRRGD
jgi:glycosyltransferase involved in cell wall biosynthesis